MTGTALYPFDLGTYQWTATSSSPSSQTWANRGLIWAYCFNHDEALRCFERAAKDDPNCAMAYWGIAFSAGPNYNKAWRFFDKQDLLRSTRKANDALTRASELADQASPTEQGLIQALSNRFPRNDIVPDDFGPLNRAYADAMRRVYEARPNDIDVAALFAESLLCLTPRGLWDINTGEPTGLHTIEARKVIETAFGSPGGFNHMAHCHLYIHLMEMCPNPELALPAADRLRGLVPDASHMLHMPTHIDAAVGDYRHGVESNNRAIVADDKYFAIESAPALYSVYRVHYVAAKLYSAMMAGRSRETFEAVEKLEQIVESKLLVVQSPNMADWAEAHLGSRAHALIRFGHWEEILRLDVPDDRELYSASTAVILYAKAIAFSAMGRVEEAEIAQAEFETARQLVPQTRVTNIPCTASATMVVASAMLAGELEYRKGNFAAAFATLREAAQREDELPYSDPPSWMQPVRHALGGLLLEQGRLEEAERAFREDLGLAKGYPRRRARLNNVWGLHGLYECFVRAGKGDEALSIETQLAVASASADLEMTVSCFCRTTKADGNSCCR